MVLLYLILPVFFIYSSLESAQAQPTLPRCSFHIITPSRTGAYEACELCKNPAELEAYFKNQEALFKNQHHAPGSSIVLIKALQKIAGKLGTIDGKMRKHYKEESCCTAFFRVLNGNKIPPSLEPVVKEKDYYARVECHLRALYASLPAHTYASEED